MGVSAGGGGEFGASWEDVGIGRSQLKQQVLVSEEERRGGVS
jgi:hypothetical protein